MGAKSGSFLLLVAFSGSLFTTTYSLEVCCSDLGCFNSKAPFYDLLLRPVISVPNCDILPRLALHLNTRDNSQATQILDPYHPPGINSSWFSAARPTKILIHGHTDNFDRGWWLGIKDNLLVEGDYNVIRVDWSAGNTIPYMQSVANARLVGAYVAKFINLLKDVLAYDPLQVHIVGHSLGTHVAGYAGERVVQVGRITGLDPAGPLFTNTDTDVRLDMSDAKVVDTLVTDGSTLLQLAFGTTQAMGHLNFFPNGGKTQPGCDQGMVSQLFGGLLANTANWSTIDIAIATSYETIACNHIAALTLFSESILAHSCMFKAYQCSDYEKFLKGDCFSCNDRQCSPAGYHVATSEAKPWRAEKFYFQTEERQPFCSHPFRFRFVLQNMTIINSAPKPERGLVWVTLFGTQGTSAKMLLSPGSLYLNPGQEYVSMLTVPSALGSLQSVVFYWEARDSLLSPLNMFRKATIYLSGDLEVINEDGVRTTFRPLRANVVEEKDLLAKAVV